MWVLPAPAILGALLGQHAVVAEKALFAAGVREPAERLRRRPRNQVSGGIWSSWRPLGNIVSSSR